jgi:hypothetical protein
MFKQVSRNLRYEQHFPSSWQFALRECLHKEFLDYPVRLYEQGKHAHYLPPVEEDSMIGKIAGLFPSKPQGITLWGTIYYTPSYPTVKEKLRKKYGDEEALVYEFGMYAHETYHAIEQELTKRVRFLGLTIMSGKAKWFLKYFLNLLKTPNAYKHPMEKPAYAFQKYMKEVVRSYDSDITFPNSHNNYGVKENKKPRS